VDKPKSFYWHKVIKRILLPVVILAVLMSRSQSLAKSTDIRGQTMTPSFDIRPELGIQMGACLLFPQLTTGMEYNDNIYAIKDNKESDQILTLTPRFLAASTWYRHDAKLDAGVNKGFYMDHSNQDYMDSHVFADGRLDIVKDSYLEARCGYENYYEDPENPEYVGAWEEPARYDRYTTAGKIHHGMGRSFVQTGGQAISYKYDNVDLVGGGSQDLEYRDYNEYGVNARVGYESMPGITPFIEGRLDWREYDEQVLTNRDSDGYRIGIGTQIYLSGVTTGEVFAGYLTQKYDGNLYEDISSPWYGLSLVWKPTQLTSIMAGVKQSVNETTQIGYSGVIATDVSLKIDHELRRNVRIGLNLGYDIDDYKGLDIIDDITDHYYRAGPSLTYQLNPNLKTDLRYEYTKLDSSEYDTFREYDVNKLIFSITGSL
jgi:hypothetical protein